MSKRIYCAWCGEDMGEANRYDDPREPSSCGRAECNREVRGLYREMDEQARYAAECDDYERYR